MSWWKIHVNKSAIFWFFTEQTCRHTKQQKECFKYKHDGDSLLNIQCKVWNGKQYAPLYSQLSEDRF